MTYFTGHPDTSLSSSIGFMVADGTTPDLGSLLATARLPVLPLSATLNPLLSITAAFADEIIDTLHIVGPGRPGAILLGGTWIDEPMLLENTGLLKMWRITRIALWSSRVGAAPSFIRMLSRLTGADVYAAEGTVGYSDDGSVWTLQTSDGKAMHGSCVWPQLTLRTTHVSLNACADQKPELWK